MTHVLLSPKVSPSWALSRSGHVQPFACLSLFSVVFSNRVQVVAEEGVSHATAGHIMRTSASGRNL